MIGSTFKGLLTGLLIGFFANKFRSLALGLVFGLAVGLFLAFLIAAMPDPATGKHYWWEIMLPGAHPGPDRGLRDLPLPGSKPPAAAA